MMNCVFDLCAVVGFAELARASPRERERERIVVYRQKDLRPFRFLHSSASCQPCLSLWCLPVSRNARVPAPVSVIWHWLSRPCFFCKYGTPCLVLSGGTFVKYVLTAVACCDNVLPQCVHITISRVLQRQAVLFWDLPSFITVACLLENLSWLQSIDGFGAFAWTQGWVSCLNRTCLTGWLLIITWNIDTSNSPLGFFLPILCLDCGICCILYGPSTVNN